MTTLHYRLRIAPAAPAPGVPEVTTGPSAPPVQLCLDLGINPTRADGPDPVDPATSNKRGSFNYDRQSGEFPREWSDLATFEAWRREEELAMS